MQDLRPCPFCKSDKIIYGIETYYEDMYSSELRLPETERASKFGHVDRKLSIPRARFCIKCVNCTANIYTPVKSGNRITRIIDAKLPSMTVARNTMIKKWNTRADNDTE